jgi:hypothetical protein
VDPHHFDADPDPAFHFEADPDPTFQFDADPYPDTTTHFFPEFRISSAKNDNLRLPLPFHFDADPDPAFHFDADPDPAFHYNEDPDPVELRIKTEKIGVKYG